MKTVRFTNKIAALKRLKEAGIKDEKDLQAADLDIFLSIHNISIQELKILSDMKKAIKRNQLLKYLLEEEEPYGREDERDN